METPRYVVNTPYDPYLLTAKQALATFGLKPRQHDRLRPDKNLLHMLLPKGERDPHTPGQYERRFFRPYVAGLRGYIDEPPYSAMNLKNVSRDFASEPSTESVIRQSLDELDSVIEFNTNRGLISDAGMVAILNISKQIVPKWLRNERFGFQVVRQAGNRYVTAESFLQSYAIVPPESIALSE